MRLKTNIFLWVFFATLLPLTILVFGATLYSERQFEKQVAGQMIDRLNNLVSELDRHLFYEREMILSLSEAESMRDFLPVLELSNRSDLHAGFFERADQLNKFLTAFQSVVPGFSTLRVINAHADTLIKVRIGRGNPGFPSGIEDLAFKEEELQDQLFVERLRQLPPGELSFVALPKKTQSVDPPEQRTTSLLTAAVPLVRNENVAGYLLVDISGNQLDHILGLVPRIYQGSIIIAEVNSDYSQRDGLILYDDTQNRSFTSAHRSQAYLQHVEKNLWESVQQKPYGDIISSDGSVRTFFLEYSPYPKRFASWVVAVRVKIVELRTPFTQIRYGIFSFVFVALLISLALARFGARNIARPVIEMTRSMKEYARGNHKVRVQVHGGEEIRQLENSFNDMADTLDHTQHMMLQGAKLASIGEMAAGIGHEINNPLNNILLLCTLLKRSIPSENQKAHEDVQSLREEALRASGIIKGILNFARQETPSYSQFDVQQWVEETLSLVRQSAHKKHLDFQLNTPGDCLLEGDRTQLQQVLVNLLLNAIQASPRESTVEVSVQCTATEFVLTVQDQGEGIATHFLERIFDPFFSTKAEGEGSGLGLSISLGIVEHHQGSLAVINNPPAGVLATVRLPLTQVHRPSHSVTREALTEEVSHD